MSWTTDRATPARRHNGEHPKQDRHQAGLHLFQRVGGLRGDPDRSPAQVDPGDSAVATSNLTSPSPPPAGGAGEGETEPVGVLRVGAATCTQVHAPSGVGVAVLDTGIDLTNTDLNAVSGINCIKSGTPAQDDNGHGTTSPESSAPRTRAPAWSASRRGRRLRGQGARPRGPGRWRRSCAGSLGDGQRRRTEHQGGEHEPGRPGPTTTIAARPTRMPSTRRSAHRSRQA